MNFHCILVVPSYNEAATIGRCLESIRLAPLPKNFAWAQWLVMDDSTDGSDQVIGDWRLEHPSVPLVLSHSAIRRGKSNALNAAHTIAIDLDAERTVVVCCDSDGEVEANALRALLTPFQDDPDLAIVWGTRLPRPYKQGQWGSAFQMYATEQVAQLLGESADRAQGSLFAYRLNSLRGFRWQRNTALDDVQLSDFAAERGLRVKSAWAAIVRVTPASTFRDFCVQLLRPLWASTAPSRTRARPSPRVRIAAAMRAARKRPFEACAYLAEWALAQAVNTVRPRAFADFWPMAESTKDVDRRTS